jgi:two-component system cell cycle sensor histidine kinase/response regulator CckA
LARGPFDELQAAVDAIPVLVHAFTDDLRLVIWNHACEQLTGYRREELLGRSDILDLLYGGCPCRDLIEASAIGSGRPAVIESELATRSGEKRAVSWVCTRHASPMGEGTSWFIGVDVTDLRAGAGPPRISAAKADRIFDRISDALLTSRPDCVVTSANPAAERMLALSEEEAIGRSLLDLAGGEDKAEFAARCREVLDTQTPKSFECRSHVGGKTRWLNVRLTPLAADEIAVLCTEVTARKEAEEVLQRAEEHYRSLVERPDMGYLRATPDGKYLYASPHVELVTGYPQEEFLKLGTSILAKFIHPDDIGRVHAMLEGRKAEPPRRADVEFRIIGPDRETRWWWSRQAPVFDENGELQFFDIVTIDVTEKKALEEALLHAQKMEAVGTLAGGLAHDFNNLLTAILGNLSLAIEDIGPAHPATSRLQTAERAANRASSLTRQLLSFTRKQEPKREVVSLCACVEDSISILRRSLSPGVTVDAHRRESPVFVAADPSQLGQVVLNLCVNARDAMPDGGRLTIRCGVVEIAEAEAAENPDASPGRFARLTVADTGSGMPEEVRKRAFEPFFTTRAESGGTGLGLAVAYGIVRQHGGWITVESEPGLGSTFNVYLPLAEPATDTEARAAPEVAARGTETILVVDDEEMVRGFARDLLERSGYTVVEAEDGIHALDLLKGPHQKVDLVLLDFVMPRLTGMQALQELARVAPDVPVIVASGYITDDELAVAEQGARAVLQKPFSKETLVSTVRRVLDGETLSEQETQ